MNLDPRRPFRPFGRIGARTAASIRRHPRPAAGLALAGILGVSVVAWLAFGRTGSTSNVAASDPGFTFRGGWSLVELQRHIQAGDVEAITAAPVSTTGPASEQLLARTT